MRFPTPTNITAAPIRAASSRSTRQHPLSLFDKFFSEFFTDASFDSAPSSTATPQVDVTETDKGLRFDFALPGISESDIHIEIHEGRLVMEAERKLEDHAEGEAPKVHAREIRSGKIARRIVLPKGLDHDSVVAVLDKGILRVELNKIAPAQPRKIQIQTASPAPNDES